jgi:Tfp pilus assembly protein PilF
VVVGEAVDFFVSYTSADRPWAEWIAWELEQAGHSVVIQAWDFAPGSNFVVEMDSAAQNARRTIAVLSPAFLESAYCRAEWTAAFRADPTGEQRKFVPVRVRDCEPDGLLGSVAYVDLVGLSQAAARAKLLAGVTEGRGKPTNAPAFPDTSGEKKTERVRLPEAGAAIFNVPITTHTFVGRQEQLRRLEEALSGDGAVAITQVHAIHGMGGVGKTQLAARYARHHRDDYDMIWWLRAEQQPTLHADLAGLAVTLGLADAEADEQDMVRVAKGWLEHNGRWLLVFDNAPDPDAIAELLPEGDGGHVLITSRAHADWRALRARPLALDVWQRAESREFLRERTGEQDVSVLDAVAEALGDLPLALEQAAAYTNAKAITLTGYAERLRDRAPQLFGADPPLGYGHSVATVWQLAFEQITQHSVASDLLGVCAYLAPERIPRELLDAIVQHSETSAVGQQTADDAIELLLAYALLTPAVEQTFGMHRLIGQLIRERGGSPAQARPATAAVIALYALWPDRPWEHEQWPACERLLSHALTVVGHSEQQGAAPEQTAIVLLRVGQYQMARAQLTSARELIERALAIQEPLYGPEHPQVAITLSNFGTVQDELGEFESACATQQRALAINEAVYGPEHPDVALTLTNLGIVQRQLGELERAHATQQRAVAIFEAVHGPEHPQVAHTLTNLGIVQCELGELERARATQQRALAINEAVYGPEHPNVAKTLTSLGTVQRELGEFEAARATQQRALAIKEAVYGPKHPDVANTLSNLGNVELQLGELEQARTLLQRALAIFEAVYGPEHPQLANTLGNLGSVNLQLGELEQARTLLQRALATFERFFGSDYVYTVRVRSLLESIDPLDQRKI